MSAILYGVRPFLLCLASCKTKRIVSIKRNATVAMS